MIAQISLNVIGDLADETPVEINNHYDAWGTTDQYLRLASTIIAAVVAEVEVGGAPDCDCDHCRENRIISALAACHVLTRQWFPDEPEKLDQVWLKCMEFLND